MIFGYARVSTDAQDLTSQLSQSKAAELAGISRAEFLDSLSGYGVSPFQVTPEELEREVARG